MLKSIWKDNTIAETNNYDIVERNYYFPQKSVKKEFLKKGNTHTTCPSKGCIHQIGAEFKQDKEKPLVGFFPYFYSAGETIPLIKIAKSYIYLGGEVVFFSHGGEYEYLAKENGLKIIRLQTTNNFFKEKKPIKKIKEKIPIEKLLYKKFSKEFIMCSVKEEIEAFRKTGIEAIVSSFNLTSSISARVLKIPLVVLISGVAIPQYYKSGFVTFPDSYENFLTRLLPPSLKNQIARWYLLNNKMLVKKFNKVAKKHNIKPFQRLNDIYLGDYTLVCDDIHFLGLKPTKDLPLENYIGPIINGDFSQKEQKRIDNDVQNFLKRKGRSILFTMGSRGYKILFLRILNALNNTNHNVIASYTTMLNEDELPKLNDNILLKKFIKNIKMVNQLVDLAVISGGRGTVYTAAFSSKPVIGIPMHIEQQFNIDNLVRYGMAIRLSKKYFTEKKLLLSINKIFNNYDYYLKNARLLKIKLPEPRGEENAAKRILEIATTEVKKQYR